MRFRQYLILVENKIEYIIKKQEKKILDAFGKDRSPLAEDLPRNVFMIVDTLSKADYNGKFLQWIVNQYIKSSFQLEDIDNVKHYIKLFVKHKKELPKKDINQYKIYQDLQDDVDALTQQQRSSEKIKELTLSKMKKKKEFEVFYKDSSIEVVIPKTEEASCFFGEDTRWCTADTTGRNAFEDYNRHGKLYIILPKKNSIKGKMQFHFESDQFMDYRDRNIEFKELDKGLLSKLQDIFKKLAEKNLFLPLLKKPSEAIQLAVVKQRPMDIEFIDNPTEKVQLAAVIGNISALSYIKKLSEAVQLYVVKNIMYGIKYLTNPSEKIQLEAIKHSFHVFFKVEKFWDDTVQLVAEDFYGELFGYGKPSKK
ncbi:hypothetical protein KAH94_06250, partial [bacterium]|nr:hypothetical protein [bacterium]